MGADKSPTELLSSLPLAARMMLACAPDTSGENVQPRAISRANAEHYLWGQQSDGWHLSRDQKLSVIEEQMQPGTGEVLHYHQVAQQFFYLLSGEAVMEMDGRDLRLAVGEGIHVPPGALHRIRNESADTIRFLVISQPHSHGDRVVVETSA
jgi:mannose-6-phosphate isomerase-like protein (cupin superfamily)